MRNIQLVLEYDGSRYDGWQKQPKYPNRVMIQDKVEAVLSQMEGEEIQLVGAAKTEAGVHAYAQVANFQTNSTMKVYEIKHYLNRYLPRDIAVKEALEVPERFHSSYNAKSFVYEYKIGIGEVPNVFARKYSYYCFDSLDLLKMRQAAEYLKGKHDFKAFSDNKKQKKSTERELFDIDIYGDKEEVLITLHGDDFWPFMVRIIVATLLEVGTGKMEPQYVEQIIEKKDRNLAPAAADAKGLFLTDVKY
ncbi:tRNA pseudouridine(38-40) synthase TruA [Anaerosporobacter faecicola]|uniref:tRNA pseudouridine(38-40) synthase TruA n=1 Tax=Anaerosporobacter faecicola TaxID=2718714 RepID=UPI00143BCF57|nr:tRNA pseudouridine(38-40) synthase TruA [Anaerosporobacter faecicola]